MRKLCLFLISLVLLNNCGFRPLYGGGSTLAGNNTSLDQVIVEDMPGATGLNMKNALIDRFYHHGYPDNAPYSLSIALQESSRAIVIEKNDTTTRTQLVMTAHYRLIDRSTRAIVDKGNIRAVSAFNNLPSQYTTMVTQADARDMATRELADKLTLRMAVILEQQAK